MFQAGQTRSIWLLRRLREARPLGAARGTLVPRVTRRTRSAVSESFIYILQFLFPISGEWAAKQERVQPLEKCFFLDFPL